MSASRFKLAIAIAIVVTLASLLGVLFAVHRPAVGSAAAAATASPSPSAHPSGPQGPHPFLGGAPGGAIGTVTGVSGGTITLRTLGGTLTVTTTSSTTYSKAGQSIGLGDIRDDDVLRVRPVRPSGSSTPQASPSTTVTAQSITVVLPAFFGRVTSISGPTIFIVTRDGQQAYVFTTSKTTYAQKGARASFSDVKAGDYISAEGTQTDLKHLTAIRVAIGSGAGPGSQGPGVRFPGFSAPRFPGGPRPSATPDPSGTAT